MVLRAPTATIHTRSGPPPEGLGDFGDYCMVLDADRNPVEIYGPKTLSGGWGEGFSTVGATGPAGIVNRGDWAAGTQYAALDGVHHRGAFWQAARANQGVEPTVAATADWRLLARGLFPAGEWAANTLYRRDDLIRRSGSAYRSLTDHAAQAASPPETNAADYVLLAGKGDRGLNPRGAWSQAATYQRDDLATRNGSTWLALRQNTNAQPAEGADWTLFAGKGDTGTAGTGVPAGGSAGQVLKKTSGTDYATEWGDTGGGADDLLSLSRTEVAVSGAASLLVSAFGKMHRCALASSYAVTLPPIAGNAGKMLAVRMASSGTGLVSVKGSGSETIDGQNERVMWAQESALLLCVEDGWRKIGGRTRPMGCRMRVQKASDPNTAQAIANNAATKILVNQADYDNGGLADTANSRMVVRRSGTYQVGFIVYYATAASSATRVIGNVEIAVSPDATRVGSRTSQFESSALANSFMSTGITTPGDLLGGEALIFQAYHNAGVTRNLYGDPNTAATLFHVTEIPAW